MRFRYGTLLHRTDEAKLMGYFIRPRMSPRGTRITQIHEMHLQIELFLPVDQAPWSSADAQAWFNTEITKINNAYSINDQDAIFYHDDGTPTRHTMFNSSSLSGVKVMQNSWPRGQGDEYATVRTGYVVLRSEYLMNDSPLWYFEERVINQGAGGPIWMLQTREVGLPVRYNLAQYTPQAVQQVGQAIGIGGYPLSRIVPIYPAQFEHLDRRVVSPRSPTRMGYSSFLYPIDWAFQFELPAPQNSYPNFF